eukprot:375201_1
MMAFISHLKRSKIYCCKKQYRILEKRYNLHKYSQYWKGLMSPSTIELPEMAVITGAGNGIGKALAFYCADKQIHLILVDINKDALNQTQKEIEASYHKIKIITFAVDVTDNNKLRETILPSLSSLNYNIKYLFNCAG